MNTAMPAVDNSADAKEAGVVSDVYRPENSSDTDNNHVDATAQPGVQGIEAVTVAWTTHALWFAYISIWMVYFVEGMLNVSLGALSPYVTSGFALHSLTPTVTIISTIIGGVTNLTIAKILDVFGRPQGYLCCLFIAVVGLVMMAACRTVEMYAAAMVFYTVGNNGLQYSVSVFVADTTSLRNRGLVQALASSSNLITCWLGGPIGQGFLSGPGWRWCFGMFSILIPVVSLPLVGLLLHNYFKAKKQGLIPERNTNRSVWQSIIYYCREFDAVGLLLISVGTALFLLPFNLYAIQGKGWNSPLIICMLVFGILLLVLFVAWEKWFAPITFIPYNLLLDRTVFGACLLSATVFVSFYCWNSYFSSFLQVVNGLSVAHASYVVQSYTVISVVCSMSVGGLIHYTGRFKAICLYFAVPMSVFGLGLMIHFRDAHGNIGFIVMCQIFIAVGAGIVVITDEIAMLSAAAHQHVAVAIAVLGLFGSIGGAIGLTVSSAIWQSTFPTKLMEYLPVEDMENFFIIYADINTQLAYPVGSPTRVAIQQAYADAQKNMLIAGTAVWVIGFVGTLMWRDINVIGIKQTRGHVW